MAALTLTWDFRITVGGETHVFASPSTPPTLTVTQLQQQTLAIATATTVVLWKSTATEATPTTFDFFYALSSVAGFLEFTTLDGNSNERVYALPMAAGIPFVLGADDAFYSFTAGPAGDAFAGALDVIDKIRFRNQSGSTTTLTYAVGT